VQMSRYLEVEVHGLSLVAWVAAPLPQLAQPLPLA
jgi:hypothetical protein